MSYPKREYKGSLLCQEILSKEKELEDDFLYIVVFLGILLCCVILMIFFLVNPNLLF